MAEQEPMEKGRLEAAVKAIDAAEAEKLQKTIGLPSNVRVITNSLMLRVNKDTDGALTLKADMENTQFYFEAIIRVCSETATLDQADGWGMPKKHIEGGELLAAFGCGGAHGLCVAPTRPSLPAAAPPAIAPEVHAPALP